MDCRAEACAPGGGWRDRGVQPVRALVGHERIVLGAQDDSRCANPVAVTVPLACASQVLLGLRLRRRTLEALSWGGLVLRCHAAQQSRGTPGARGLIAGGGRAEQRRTDGYLATARMNGLSENRRSTACASAQAVKALGVEGVLLELRATKGICDTARVDPRTSLIKGASPAATATAQLGALQWLARARYPSLSAYAVACAPTGGCMRDARRDGLPRSSLRLPRRTGAHAG